CERRDEDRRRHEPAPRASSGDGGEHLEVREAHGVAHPAPPQEPPDERDARSQDEKRQQIERALEGHRTLAQTAWTWTTAGIRPSSASPCTETSTRLPLILRAPLTVPMTLALGGWRVRNAN